MTNLHTIKDHFKESKLYVNRVVIAVIIVLLLVLTLLGRLVSLQIYQYDRYKMLSLHNQVRIIPIVPNRGLIFDRHGTLLAENIPVFNLEIIPEQVVNMDKTLSTINAIMPLTETEKQQFSKQLKYKSRSEGIPIRIKLTEEEVAKFSVEKHKLPGVEIAARLIRHYPLQELFAHAIGYTGPINEQELAKANKTNYRGTYHIGKTGIEKFYEETLHGKVGYQHVETDARGRTIRILKHILPTPGSDLYLSLDVGLQQVAHKALQEFKGAIVVIEPKSGHVLTMVSTPSFDPNVFSQGMNQKTYDQLANSPEQPLFNRAIQARYPPGSIIKPLVALKGLETHTIDPQESISDPGWYQINNEGRLYRDLIYTRSKQGHGLVNLEKAIVQSCDTYFFRLAHNLGIDNLYEIYTRFGLGQTTDLDIYGESAGLVPSVKWKKENQNTSWYPGDTLNIGVGQGLLLTTPLQMAHVTATLANRGKLVKPQLVTTIDAGDHLITPAEHLSRPIEKNLLQSADNIQKIIDAMQKVVHMKGGTAHRISRGLPYQVAGKTGTAQVYSLKPDEQYNASKVKSHLRDHSWFIAFAPVEDPQIAFAILIENKYKTSSVDIARILLDGYFNHPSDSKAAS